MATLKKFKLDGQEVDTLKVSATLANAEANGQMIKDYIIALRANARQWSACTKTRSEVSHTTKKPHPQKGGGRARQGSLVSPQYKGGGRVFGPRPKFDQHVRINKKERQAAIRFLFSEKLKQNKIFIIENTQIDAPRTKSIADFLKNVGINGRTLFLGEGEYGEIEAGSEKKRVSIRSEKHANFIKSVRNIPKTHFSLVANINGYDLLVANNIVMTEEAFNELNEWLG